VDPQLYEDNYPHFFTFSTRDGYQTTGCYDMEPLCGDPYGSIAGSGVVLIQNPANIPGWALLDASVTELAVYWYKAPDHNWWVSANGWVGYIPGTLFANGNGGGKPFGGSDPTNNYYPSEFIAGGEVADSNALIGDAATPTDMGNGQFAGLASAYQRNVICTLNCDPDSDFTDVPAPVALAATDPNLYSIDASPTAGGTSWGKYFYFGGPGLSVAAPAVPIGLGASTFDGEIVLNWNSVANANTYDVHMSTTPGPPPSFQFTRISENRLDIDSLQNGTTYYFNVRAVNDAGTSGWSNQISAVPNPPVPPTPTGLTAHGGVQQVTLTWSPANGASSYTVKYATSSGGTLGNAQAGITSTSFTYTALQSNKTYYFVVSAQNARGSSADSARVSGLTVTAAPTGVSATASSGKVTVKWSSTSGASSYTVFRSQTSGSAGTAIASGLKTTSYTDAAVTKGTKYYYLVVAVNASGPSPNSSQVNATP
jgi:fibronectin type 3 domain-containing protein